MSDDSQLQFNDAAESSDKNIIKATHGYWIRRELVRRATEKSFPIVSAWWGTELIERCEDGQLARSYCQQHYDAVLAQRATDAKTV